MSSLNINLNSISPTLIGKSVLKFFRRFHFIFFFIIVSISFAAGVLFINQTLNQIRDDTSYTSDISAGSIDTTTLKQLTELHTSGEVESLPELPADTRTNPFGE